MHSCLFVIDVQNGFITPKTDFVVQRIESLLSQQRFDYTLFTQFQNQPASPYQTILQWNKLQTTSEQALAPNIQPYAEYTLKKPIYTAVTTEILEFLTSHRIKQVHLLGIDTDCCVLKTAVDLFEHDFHPIVLAHYCASNGGEESHKAALKVLERLIGKENIIYDPL